MGAFPVFSHRYSPDVVFLQEVIPPYHSMLKKKASSYEIITGNSFPVMSLVFFFEKHVNARNPSKPVGAQKQLSFKQTSQTHDAERTGGGYVIQLRCEKEL